jgi:hypothetical protein
MLDGNMFGLPFEWSRGCGRGVCTSYTQRGVELRERERESERARERERESREREELHDLHGEDHLELQ